MFPQVSLILGGASSGKSGFAERLVLSASRACVYIATAQALDDEMAGRIRRHKKSRGSGWRTIEEPLDLVAALTEIATDQVVLVDCLTLWLSNQMMADHDTVAANGDLITALEGCASPVVLVSNEVGGGLVPDNALSRQFQQTQGQLNQQVAARADLVVQVTAGLPMVLKGELPGRPG